MNKSKVHLKIILNKIKCLLRYVFGTGEERNLKNLMGSALGGADFEWAKTGDIRSAVMDKVSYG